MQQVTESKLAELVGRHLDVRPNTVRLERCATGKHNQTWFATGEELSLVLRIAPPDDRRTMLFYEYHMMRQEPELHDLLRERTGVPVPEILDFDFEHQRIDAHTVRASS